MIGRLFWKIFAAFFLAFIAQVYAMYVLLNVVYPFSPRVELADYEVLEKNLLASTTTALHRGTLSDLDPRTYSGDDAPLSIREFAPTDALNNLPQKSRVVTSASGQRYVIEVQTPIATKRELPSRAQLYVNATGLVLGLLFAGGLALYLSRPIRALRTGLEKFAEGNLRIRLGERVGSRRDEVADLARDFDGMADRVEALIRSREQLINDVSHELRSPLTRLRLAIALARQRPERTSAALERVEAEARRLDEIVDELLTLSRLESGAADLQGYFDLSELLRKLIADARFESGSVQVNFEEQSYDEASAHRSILGDAELIRRAVENVVRNAIRFSPGPGIISITLVHGPTEAMIRIDDEGPGLPHDKLVTVFEPFVKGTKGGFGLGLAIAKRAVLAHGGSIVAENRIPNGLRVTIRLPTCLATQSERPSSTVETIPLASNVDASRSQARSGAWDVSGNIQPIDSTH